MSLFLRYSVRSAPRLLHVVCAKYGIKTKEKKTKIQLEKIRIARINRAKKTQNGDFEGWKA